MSSKNRKVEIRRVVTYARVSTLEQAEKDLSIPAQLDAMREYCAQRGYEVLDKYVEPGASGTDDNRKIFRRMLEDTLAPSSQVHAIVVYHSSRFMRDAAKARTCKELLRRRGVRVIAMGQETSNDPMGRIIEGLFELIDQYESEMNGMRTSAAMRENAKQGYFNGSTPPYGFKIEKIEIRPGHKKNKLVPNPEEREALRFIVRTFVGSSGAKATARELNQRGYRYRKGQLWTKAMILKVIDDESAIGTYFWGRTDAQTGAPNDREDWVAVKCEPLIDRELFEMAQKVRDSRDPEKFPGRAASSPLLLANLIKCGKCGASYQLETSGKQLEDGSTPFRYYNCSGYIRSGKERCGGFRIPIDNLEREILDHVGTKLFSADRVRKLLQDLAEETGIMNQRSGLERKQIQKELEDIKRRIAKWEEGWETGATPREVGFERVREYQRKRAELEATLSRVVPIASPAAHLYTPANIARFQESIREMFLGARGSQTKNYLRFMVNRITIDGDKVEIQCRTESILNKLTAGTTKNETEASTSGLVLTSVPAQLPDEDSNLGHGD